MDPTSEKKKQIKNLKVDIVHFCKKIFAIDIITVKIVKEFVLL